MRTLKLQVQTSIDGYMAGPDGEMDWMTLPWSEDADAYVAALTEPVDCIVLGRKLAEGFIPYWSSYPADEPAAAAQKMTDTPKVVISRTLDSSPWEHTVVAGGPLADTVRRLKAQPGGDIIVYGGSALVMSLLAEDLVDELHLLVNPVVLGAGLPVFPRQGSHRPYRRVEVRPFACGITAMHLEPIR